ncbi:ParB/RepB/Spo0J family partition protein [Propionispira raffinosivorans]|uniref:ParB/RepB/Spo0J family partition protein n=1 Tax=Propionispira raffinosivorans TaxID=86959 RepID=UPI000362F929|nr:ParB/RepB/Spo0J family partition protein [Propionispira raffinosivorans]
MSKITHSGLGKGLGALIQDTAGLDADTKDKVKALRVEDIVPNQFQPRTEFNDESLDELMHSVLQYGVLQPVLVRKKGTGYELIAGERRLRASKLAGCKTIPAIVREYSDAEMTEIALIENLQREDLNSIEEARAYERLLIEFGFTQELLAQKVGRSRSHIANFLRLLNLSVPVQSYIANGSLTMGQAKPLLGLAEADLQIEAADFIIAENLSARAVEDLVKKLIKVPTYLKDCEEREETIPKPKEIFVVEAEDHLQVILGTKVKIRSGKIKSKIEIEFYSEEDLERILETLTKPTAIQSSLKQGQFIV